MLLVFFSQKLVNYLALFGGKQGDLLPEGDNMIGTIGEDETLDKTVINGYKYISDLWKVCLGFAQNKKYVGYTQS